jgi:palmitoyltransferase ZDHHC9/14/18
MHALRCMVSDLQFFVFNSFVDHHCPWVGNCVGKRNHKYFASFILYTGIHCIFAVISGILALIGKYPMYLNKEIMLINFPCWITTIFSAMMAFTLIPFGGYHFWLIFTGKTTNEEMRGRYDMWEGNPYDRGSCLSNCKVSFSTFPSMVFEDGYQISGYEETPSSATDNEIPPLQQKE